MNQMRIIILFFLTVNYNKFCFVAWNWNECAWFSEIYSRIRHNIHVITKKYFGFLLVVEDWRRLISLILKLK